METYKNAAFAPLRWAGAWTSNTIVNAFLAVVNSDPDSTGVFVPNLHRELMLSGWQTDERRVASTQRPAGDDSLDDVFDVVFSKAGAHFAVLHLQLSPPIVRVVDSADSDCFAAHHAALLRVGADFLVQWMDKDGNGRMPVLCGVSSYGQVPQQKTDDCGVFAILYVAFKCRGWALEYNARFIAEWRVWIAACLASNCLLDPAPGFLEGAARAARGQEYSLCRVCECPIEETPILRCSRCRCAMHEECSQYDVERLDRFPPVSVCCNCEWGRTPLGPLRLRPRLQDSETDKPDDDPGDENGADCTPPMTRTLPQTVAEPVALLPGTPLLVERTAGIAPSTPTSVVSLPTGGPDVHRVSENI